MIVKDDNNVPDLLKRIERLSNKAMQIGIFQDGDGGKVHGEEGKDDITILEIATIHEFGAMKVNIPERSFIRKTFDEQKSNMGNVMDKFFTKYIEGSIEYDICMDAIGEYMVGLVRKTIVDMDSPPLKQLTIDRKGSSGVLVDTSKLIDSITWKVVEV